MPDRVTPVSLPVGMDAWLAAGLASLSPRQRTAVVLRFVDDLDVAAIADVMRCSPGTAKSHLSRGVQRLRDHAPEGDRHG